MDTPSIEKRGQSFSDQIQRLCFSLALAYSMAPLAAEGTEDPVTTPKGGTRAENVLLNLEPARDHIVYLPYKALGRSYSDDSARPVLSHTEFQTDELSILRAGVGVDLNLAKLGNVHFNLYSPDGDLNAGKRWALGISDKPAPLEVKKIWSVGGKLDLARTGGVGARTVIFVPQLMFNLENLPYVGGNAQMTFQYLHWDSGGSDQRPVPQLAIKWSF